MAEYKRLMEYLPLYWHPNEEMQQILQTDEIEIDTINSQSDCIYNDAFIMLASEGRIREWEKRLSIAPAGTLYDRKLKVLSYFGVFVKLNEGVIKTLTAAIYNGARAKVVFYDSEIKIVVIPLPQNYKDVIDLSILINQLSIKKPVHISIAAKAFRCVWGDINNSFSTWGEALNQRSTWKDISLHIPDYIS